MAFRAFIACASILATFATYVPDMAFVSPAGADVAGICDALMPGYECVARLDNSAYVRTGGRTPADLATAVLSVANVTVQTGYDVLQDGTTGTLHPSENISAAPKADVAFKYAPNAMEPGRRRLAQLSTPVTRAVVQTGAPYFLSFLNQKQTTLCALTRVKCGFAEDKFLYSDAGEGVVIYHVGEAVNAGHVDFLGADGKSRVAKERFVYSGYDRCSQSHPCAAWQGTHVAALSAGRLYGAAKKARVVSVVVKPGCRNIGPARALAEGLQWILDRRRSNVDAARAVVVLSAKVSVLQTNVASVMIIEALVNALLDRDVFVVTPAGAAGADACKFTPGRLPRVFTVAGAEIVQLSTKMAATPWRDSNFGPCIDVWAPATLIESAFAPDNDTTAVYSGSPQAAALAGGVAATVLSRFPTYGIAAVAERIMNYSTSSLLNARAGTVESVLQMPVA